MAARFFVLILGGLTVSFPSAWATDSVESGAPLGAHDVATVATASLGAIPEEICPQTTIKPTISPRVSHRNRKRLTAGFRIAVERIREVPECREMFTELGADAVNTVSGVRYYPIGGHELNPNVCNGSSVHTLVGGGPVWVCRKFSRLSDSHAAMVIIHEALHHAGLTEQPHDANGMTSGAINDMVVKRCGL